MFQDLSHRMPQSGYGSRMNDDIFRYNPDVSGGTEYMAREVNKRIMPSLPKFRDYRCVVLPGLLPSVSEYRDGTPTIVWLHNPLYQLGPQAEAMFADPAFLQSLTAIITVSSWHRNVILQSVNVDPDLVWVIPNAIDPMDADVSRFKNVEKVKIIHASHPDRAMEVLIPAVHRLSDEIDFELMVFNEFFPDTAGLRDDIAPIVLDPRITYYGKTPRATVMKHMREAHIHAYPAFEFEETSCLVQIEALASGCLTVVSNRGALPETSQGHGMILPFTGDREEDIDAFTRQLAGAIVLVHAGMWFPSGQVDDVMAKHSWDAVTAKWEALHDSL